MRKTLGLFCLISLGLLSTIEMAWAFECNSHSKPVFTSEWNKENFIRSIYYEFQYRALDKATMDIGYYLEKSGKNSDSFINEFVDNRCSKNRTSIGQSKLKQWMKRSENPDLTSFKGKEITNALGLKLKVIESLCSWSGNLYLIDSLALYASDKQLMSWFINELRKSKRSMRCEGLFCRMGEKKFDSPILGGGFYYTGVKNYLCFSQNINNRKGRLFAKEQSISKQVFADQLLFDTQDKVNKLITWSGFESLGKWYWSSINKELELKVDRSLNTLSQNILYESTPVLELIRSPYWYRNKGVDLKLSLGDYDQSINFLDKLKLTMDLKFPVGVYDWIQREIKSYRITDDKEQWDAFNLKFEKIIALQFSKLDVYSINEVDLTSSIQLALIEKLSRYSNKPTSNEWTIPIHLHYGLFALKYISQKKSKEIALREANN